MNLATTRRNFLAATAAVTIAGCSSGEETAAETKPQQAQSPEAGKAGAMKLSLSVRVAEKFANKKEASLTIDELIALAVKNGYQALCLRASQAGVQTPAETVRQMSGKIHDAGLAVSMVTGDFFVPQNDEHGPDCLRNITPYLDLADAFQANLIRICMKKDEDIAWAQKASDEAQERNIRLAHQSHDASMFETVDGSLDVLKKVGRPNFGLIYEPANWLIVDEPYVEGIGKLKDYIFNVYVQNHHLNPNAEAAVTTWKKGQVHLEHIGLWQEGGVRFEDVCAALHGIGYQGYVTVHQAFEGVMSVQDAVERSADYLRPLIT